MKNHSVKENCNQIASEQNMKNRSTNFFHLLPVSLTPVINIQSRIFFAHISVKIRNGAMGYSSARETDLSEKSRVARPLTYSEYKALKVDLTASIPEVGTPDRT